LTAIHGFSPSFGRQACLCLSATDSTNRNLSAHCRHIRSRSKHLFAILKREARSLSRRCEQRRDLTGSRCQLDWFFNVAIAALSLEAAFCILFRIIAADRVAQSISSTPNYCACTGNGQAATHHRD
jgi:hypothetical protein